MWKQVFIEQATRKTKHPELEMALQEEGKTVHIVTNGGASKTSGYYGWVIATQDKILYEGKGRLPCHSTQLQSLRPETTSYLAETTFLYDFVHKHNIHIFATISHHVDNNSLVSRMQRYNTGAKKDPGKMTLPDMDLQIQIDQI